MDLINTALKHTIILINLFKRHKVHKIGTLLQKLCNIGVFSRIFRDMSNKKHRYGVKAASSA